MNVEITHKCAQLATIGCLECHGQATNNPMLHRRYCGWSKPAASKKLLSIAKRRILKRLALIRARMKLIGRA